MSRGRAGPLNSYWAGDRAGYAARHSRVARARGAAKAHNCVHCAKADVFTPAHDWATKHSRDGLNIWEDWLPLCRRCHQAYDGIADEAVRLFRSEKHRAHVRELWADPEFRARHQGANRGNAVLTDFIVGRSRHQREMGESVASLARQFGVSERTLHSAVSGQTWRHVPDPYRLLADTVIKHLNPLGADEAEISLLMSAVERATAYIECQSCDCMKAELYGDPCDRCRVLGQWRKKPVDSIG